ncbi:MAG TPA: pyridoxamine 5'-phosphate oxidase family protein [Candidatus Saccharimonadales bacterium]
MTLNTRLMHHRRTGFSDRQQRIHSFLQQQYIGVLCSVTPDGDPHGTVVYFVIDDDFTIHILTKTRTRKYDNLIHHNHAMLMVYDTASQTTAQVLGIAVEYPGTSTVNTVSNRIFKRVLQTGDNQLPPLVKLQAGTFTTFSIKPVQIRMAVFARPDPGDYEDLFESIESFEL